MTWKSITIITAIILSAAIYFSPSSEPSAPLVSLSPLPKISCETTLRESGTGAGGFNVEQLLDAIEDVESGGDTRAVGTGGEVGCMQLTDGYVKDALEYLDIKPDAECIEAVKHSRQRSRDMVRAYMARYATADRLGRTPTAEDIARIHNGGPDGYKKHATLVYWEKVQARMMSQ